MTVVCGLVALPFALPGSGNSGKARSVLVFTSGPSTTTSLNAQQGEAADTATTVAPTPTTSPTVTTRPAAATTTTALVCHDSYNPACGSFRWSPAPAPASPVSVNIAYSPNPVAGQEVTFTVTYSDPNAVVVTSCPSMLDYGDFSLSQGCSVDTSCPQTRYGPWNPPGKNPSSGTVQYRHTYTNPGSYTFSVKYPAGTGCYDPYAAVLSGTVTITVDQPSPPASTGSTSG